MKMRFCSFFLAASLCLTGCAGAAAQTVGDSGDESAAQTESSAADAQASFASAADLTDMFTDRDYEIGYDESESAVITLEGSTASCESDAVQISGSTITITDEGTYILSGTLDDGMVVINAEKTDKLQLVLKDADIHSGSSAAIYVPQADKVFITLAADTVNTLSNGGAFTAVDENNIDAAIYSKEDLTVNGNGSLVIDSPAGHGIVSKDDLVFTSGTYDITAGSHGISGKDSVRIAAGSFAISAGKDGIHAENNDDETLGFLYIAGGSFAVTSNGDGMSAEAYLQIEDGTFSIVSGSSAEAQSGFDGGMTSGESEDAVSAKGIKAGGALVINGGSFFVDSVDDAVHSNGNLTITGGDWEVASGDDGFHADELLTVTGGQILITESYEGIEGLSIDISGGDITLTASDDGLNAAGGNDASGYSEFWGNDGFGADSDCLIEISGGTLCINASGDGIDSNGGLIVSGGEIYVSGPTDDANGALDFGGEATITGGIVIAAGSAGMAENFGSASTQGSILIKCGMQEAGSTISLTDSSGEMLLSWEAEKTYSSVVISCPQLQEGAAYTVSAGEYSEEITLDSLIYGSGGMGGRGFGNMGGGMKGSQP